MPRTRVKFCGVTDLDDALRAAHLGVDAIGLVFHPPAAACVDLPVAAAIAAQTPAFVDVVALLVDAEESFVREVVNTVRPQLLQFHGDEEEDFCRSFSAPYIKARRVRSGADIDCAMHPRARALLLDGYAEGVAGGGGKTFDWELIPRPCPRPLLIAGGLQPHTVGGLVARYRPWGVDVSGGVARDDDRRRKDDDKMRRFIEAVKNADG